MEKRRNSGWCFWKLLCCKKRNSERELKDQEMKSFKKEQEIKKEKRSFFSRCFRKKHLKDAPQEKGKEKSSSHERKTANDGPDLPSLSAFVDVKHSDAIEGVKREESFNERQQSITDDNTVSSHTSGSVQASAAEETQQNLKAKNTASEEEINIEDEIYDISSLFLDEEQNDSETFQQLKEEHILSEDENLIGDDDDYDISWLFISGEEQASAENGHDLENDSVRTEKQRITKIETSLFSNDERNISGKFPQPKKEHHSNEDRKVISDDEDYDISWLFTDGKDNSSSESGRNPEEDILHTKEQETINCKNYESLVAVLKCRGNASEGQHLKEDDEKKVLGEHHRCSKEHTVLRDGEENTEDEISYQCQEETNQEQNRYRDLTSSAIPHEKNTSIETENDSKEVTNNTETEQNIKDRMIEEEIERMTRYIGFCNLLAEMLLEDIRSPSLRVWFEMRVNSAKDTWRFLLEHGSEVQDVKPLLYELSDEKQFWRRVGGIQKTSIKQWNGWANLITMKLFMISKKET